MSWLAGYRIWPCIVIIKIGLALSPLAPRGTGVRERVERVFISGFRLAASWENRVPRELAQPGTVHNYGRDCHQRSGDQTEQGCILLLPPNPISSARGAADCCPGGARGH